MLEATAAPTTPEQPFTRSTADVLAGRIRVTLAGQTYVMPVLTIGENEEWRASLESELQPLIEGADDVEDAVRIMESFSDHLMTFIRSYDKTGVIPPEGDWERNIYPHELLRAVMEVRLAADPMVSYGVARLVEDARDRVTSTTPVGPIPSSPPTSSSPRRTGGRSKKSGRR